MILPAKVCTLATGMEKKQSEFRGIVGSSPPMLKLFEEIRQVAPIDIPVLISGESGTGKELVARAVHTLSDRKKGPFIPVNTGAIASELVASELFGHERGAFTGATGKQAGKFEIASGGTLFLDEIGTMDPTTQVTLLRVLETGRFQRLGGRETIDADVRILAATNEDLSRSIRAGSFREDLFHRFNVFSLHIPPLRERPADIPMLLRYFSRKYCREFSLSPPRFTKAAIQQLMNYPWSGNVREFENTLMRLLITQESQDIDVEDLPEEIRISGGKSGESVAINVGESLAHAERKLIQATLRHAQGNKKRSAEILGISRKALYGKIKRHNID